MLKLPGPSAVDSFFSCWPFSTYKPDRRAILVVHAGVHGEQQRAPAGGESVLHAVELAERGTLRIAQEQLDAVARFELADDVAGALDGFVAAAGLRGDAHRATVDAQAEGARPQGETAISILNALRGTPTIFRPFAGMTRIRF